MSSFCSSCGTATGGGKFCPKCGAPQNDASPPAGPSISQSPYVSPRKKSPLLKILLTVLAVFVVLVAVVGVKAYFFLKDVVHEAKQEMTQAKTQPAQPTQAGCDLLSKEKVSENCGRNHR